MPSLNADRKKLGALLELRASALDALRKSLEGRGYVEVTAATLCNVAGSCENPYASFPVDFYARTAYLSQSAQLHLEGMVTRLGGRYYTVGQSFRQEEQGEHARRRLPEFTLVEAEGPYREEYTAAIPDVPGATVVASRELPPEVAFYRLVDTEQDVVKHAIRRILEHSLQEVRELGGDADRLERALQEDFAIIQYGDAIGLLNRSGGNYKFGDDLGPEAERRILDGFGNKPTFVTCHPHRIKFFNIKRRQDGKTVYSMDLLLPPLGETIGGALREENGAKIRQQLNESQAAEYLRQQGKSPEGEFRQYLELFDDPTQPAPLRGGFGIGFERFVAFLISASDIRDTIIHGPAQP